MFVLLKKHFNKQQFQPGACGMFFNPFYFARKGLYENISTFADKITGKVLDVGCGQKPYEQLFRSSQYIGLEIDSPQNRQCKSADFYYDGVTFPFSDNEFDSIVANEVFEHVFNPTEFLKEINRVLKPSGILLLTVPFCWDEHEQPYDYARYSSFGLVAIVEKNGFKVISKRKSMNDIRTLFQLFNGYVYKKTFTSNRYVNFLTTLLLMAPFNILGELLAKVLPVNDDLYLDNIILATKNKDVRIDKRNTLNKVY
ncbi:MAG TPA: methyltransferase domain-containing protein [Nitrospirota bacterium]|nr:methyltransferase domain-containing protein [Nitrospirota bacterium]HUL01207.1 methyltransferase domain-containing protein [Nitrospirota bacterium]